MSKKKLSILMYVRKMEKLRPSSQSCKEKTLTRQENKNYTADLCYWSPSLQNQEPERRCIGKNTKVNNQI
jgi:hypothetical protein